MARCMFVSQYEAQKLGADGWEKWEMLTPGQQEIFRYQAAGLHSVMQRDWMRKQE